MKVELIVALIAGTVALASAGGTIWATVRNSKHSEAIEKLKIENDRLKAAAQRQKEISNFSVPLVRSAYDLQSRLYNILKQNLPHIYLVKGNEREQNYVTNNTVFLVVHIYAGPNSLGERFSLLI
jgi:hypothetical protein